MATSISAILVPCLKSFKQIQERVQRSDYCCEEQVSSISWGDELGRLRVWAANIGAHQTGQSSLEFRLRDASHISKQVTTLLRDLDQSLNDIADELSEDRTEASEDNETPAAWPDDDSATELQQLYEELVNIIDCLYQLSMLIRKPAQHDLFVGSRMGDKAEFEFYDKEHVRNLHPRADEQISQRLGSAITRRRKYFNYRERHHRKLEEGIEDAQGIQRTTTASEMSETVATDFKIHHIDFEETSSISGMSLTSYAPSLIDGGRVTIPPPPKGSVGGKPFECPYCFFVIEIKNMRSWIRHIFKDIKPYVCTFTDCSMPDKLYHSRREWYLHETTEHHHEDFVCALCKDTLLSSKQYERSVARHLEELALFALPTTEMDDVFDTNVSTSENVVALDSADSSDHYDQASSASVTDDGDSTDTGVQGRPRSAVESHGYCDPVETQHAGGFYHPLVEPPQPEEARQPKAAATAESPPPAKEQAKPIKFKELSELFDRPTYIKVHKENVSPETLDECDLPWEWDERDQNYIVIKRWVTEPDQDILFEHTRNLRLRKLGTPGMEGPARK